MVEWYRDPVWQFVGAAVALVAIVVAWLIFRAQRNKKALVYEIETYTPLVTVDEEAKDQIEIRFKGTPVANVYLLMMRVWNNGNAPILPGDFVEPLGFHLAEGTKILTAEVVKTEPETLKPELQPNGATIGIAPLLLNGQDAFTVKLLVAGGGEKPVVKASGRIAGVKTVMSVKKYEGPLPQLVVLVAGMTGATISLLVLIGGNLVGPHGSTGWMKGVSMVSGGIMGLSIGSFLMQYILTRVKFSRPG